MINGCIVTKGSKAEAISKVMEELEIDPAEEIIFIDDRIEQIQNIKINHPNVQTFLLCRKEGRYCDKKNEYCDYEVNNLSEVQLIIKSKNICAEL
jgi:predicted enzyme involved in methoxymalonyl-ACP biosynthesis